MVLALVISSLVAIAPQATTPSSSPTMVIATDPASATASPPIDDDIFGIRLDTVERMTLPTQINGAGPYAFTIDTAADRSVISDRLAMTLALPDAGGATVFGIVGPQRVGMVKLQSLQIGKRERHAVDAPVLPRAALGSAGFIGLDALTNETVLLDFRRNRISIAASPQEAMIHDPDVIVVTGRSKFGELILTDAHVGNTKIYAIIDTGAQNTIGNLAFRRLLGRKGPLKDEGARVVGVTGAALPAEAGTVPDIKFGALTVRDMAVAYADVDTFRRFGVDDKPAILIGMDMLRQFERVAIDFRRRSVRFLIGHGPARVAPAVADTREGTAQPLTL